MTSSNEISMKDLRLQQSTLTPIDGTHPPVKHTFIDLGVVDIFFSMSSRIVCIHLQQLGVKYYKMLNAIWNYKHVCFGVVEMAMVICR